MKRTAIACVAVATLFQAAGRAQTDIHGTWTAELHQGRVFLQVRTPAPPDQNRSGNDWSGDWSMGQSFPVEDLSGLPANDEHLTASAVKFDMRREAGTLTDDAGLAATAAGKSVDGLKASSAEIGNVVSQIGRAHV